MKGEFYRTLLIGCHAVLEEEYANNNHNWGKLNCPLCKCFKEGKSIYDTNCNYCPNIAFKRFTDYRKVPCSNRVFHLDINNNEFRSFFHKKCIELMKSAPKIYFDIPISENEAFKAQIRNVHKLCKETHQIMFNDDSEQLKSLIKAGTFLYFDTIQFYQSWP